MDLREQAFGVEIEMNGLTRAKAAQVVRTVLHSTEVQQHTSNVRYTGGVYDSWEIKDHAGRTWKIVRDASINGPESELVELVTPKLNYPDISLLQEVVRALRKAGAKTDSSCGIHVHIDASRHTAKSLRNLINLMASKEDLIFKALQANPDRVRHYCKPVEQNLVFRVNRLKPQTMQDLNQIWYNGFRDSATQHYHESRYHALNLHSVWYRGTVEFRMFNSTLHAGEVKAYIQFCLAVSAQALNQRSASPKQTTTDNPKYTFRTWLLRLGLSGDEFETCRKHLLKHLEGNAAWRNPNQAVGA